MKSSSRCWMGLLVWAALGSHAAAQGIYTCVDSKGRKLTADRPILDCIDREQRELNPSGTLRRKVGPSLTAEERAAQEAAARKVADERTLVEEEKRRDRALLTRYPNTGVHDKERAVALARIDELIATAAKRQQDLAVQRKGLDTEAQAFDRDPGRMPPLLRRQFEDNESQQAAQKRYVAEQQADKLRLGVRFDEERERLQPLWARRTAGVSPAAAPPSPVQSTSTRPPAAAAAAKKP